MICSKSFTVKAIIDNYSISKAIYKRNRVFFIALDALTIRNANINQILLIGGNL